MVLRLYFLVLPRLGAVAVAAILPLQNQVGMAARAAAVQMRVAPVQEQAAKVITAAVEALQRQGMAAVVAAVQVVVVVPLLAGRVV